MLELIIWLGGIALVPLVGGAILDCVRARLRRRGSVRIPAPRRPVMIRRPAAASFEAAPCPISVATFIVVAGIAVEASYGTSMVPR
jgi:hypothetical protein